MSRSGFWIYGIFYKIKEIGKVGWQDNKVKRWILGEQGLKHSCLNNRYNKAKYEEVFTAQCREEMKTQKVTLCLKEVELPETWERILKDWFIVTETHLINLASGHT